MSRKLCMNNKSPAIEHVRWQSSLSWGASGSPHWLCVVMTFAVHTASAAPEPGPSQGHELQHGQAPRETSWIHYSFYFELMFSCCLFKPLYCACFWRALHLVTWPYMGYQTTVQEEVGNRIKWTRGPMYKSSTHMTWNHGRLKFGPQEWFWEWPDGRFRNGNGKALLTTLDRYLENTPWCSCSGSGSLNWISEGRQEEI